MHALVIDDSRATRKAISLILRRIDFEVSEASNGLDALAQLRSSGLPDVALVDWNMPEMDGLEFIKAVRADKSLSKLPLIMITAESEMQHVAQAFVAGVDEYIMKPFSAEMIEEKLVLIGVGAKSHA